MPCESLEGALKREVKQWDKFMDSDYIMEGTLHARGEYLMQAGEQKDGQRPSE